MPSLEHEELVELFRRDPTLAIDLARGVGVVIPPYSSVQTGPTDLAELVPTAYRADVLLLLRDDKPVFVLVVEVQLADDPDKLFSWPFYAATARARYRCPTCVMVYTVAPAVAAWARRPIETGQPGSEFRPLVVGPEHVPEVLDPEQAKAMPYLGILSALAHGRGDNAEQVAATAWAGIEGFSEDERMVWLQILLTGLNEAARQALETAMSLESVKEQFPWFLDGQRKGELKGELRGELKGKAESILAVLASRGLSVTEPQQALLRECQELEVLDRWLVRAVTASSAEEVFSPPSVPLTSAE